MTEIPVFVFAVVVTLIAGYVFGAVAMWIGAEREERKWRKNHEESNNG